MSGNFSIYFAFFVYTAYTVVTLFKGYFPESMILKLLECCCGFIIFFGPIIVCHIANAIQTVNGMQFSVYKSLRFFGACLACL